LLQRFVERKGMASVDIGEYAGTTEDAWRKVRERLKQVVRDVTADDVRLSELQEGIAVLRRASADRLSALQALCDAAFEEQQRATSLTLNDTDDEVVLDEEASVIQEEPEQQATTPPVDQHRELQRPVPHAPIDIDSGAVLDVDKPPAQGESDEPPSGEDPTPGAQTEAGDTEKPSPPKATRSTSSRTKKPAAVEQASLLEDVPEEARRDERE
jgi:hypothetical protein